VAATRDALAARGEPAAQQLAARLGEALAAYEAVVRYMVEHRGEANAVFAGSVPYLMLAGHLAAGWQLARSWLATQQPGVDAAFGAAKRATAEFFGAHLLTRAGALRDAVLLGADSVMALPADAF
jgi:hypothetical protein